MNKSAVAIVTLGLMLLMGAYAVPSMADATTFPEEFSTQLDEGQTEQITDGLEITLDDSTNSQANVTVRDTETDETDNLSIQEGANATYNLTGGTGNVTVVETDDQAAQLDVTYDPMFGWSPAAQAVIGEIELILTLILFLVVLGSMAVIIQ